MMVSAQQGLARVSESYRRVQLAIGVSGMSLIAGLQYGQALFAPDIQRPFGLVPDFSASFPLSLSIDRIVTDIGTAPAGAWLPSILHGSDASALVAIIGTGVVCMILASFILAPKAGSMPPATQHGTRRHTSCDDDPADAAARPLPKPEPAAAEGSAMSAATSDAT